MIIFRKKGYKMEFSSKEYNNLFIYEFDDFSNKLGVIVNEPGKYGLDVKVNLLELPNKNSVPCSNILTGIETLTFNCIKFNQFINIPREKFESFLSAAKKFRAQNTFEPELIDRFKCVIKRLKLLKNGKFLEAVILDGLRADSKKFTNYEHNLIDLVLHRVPREKKIVRSYLLMRICEGISLYLLQQFIKCGGFIKKVGKDFYRIDWNKIPKITPEQLAVSITLEKAINKNLNEFHIALQRLSLQKEQMEQETKNFLSLWQLYFLIIRLDQISCHYNDVVFENQGGYSHFKRGVTLTSAELTPFFKEIYNGEIDLYYDSLFGDMDNDKLDMKLEYISNSLTQLYSYCEEYLKNKPELERTYKEFYDKHAKMKKNFKFLNCANYFKSFKNREAPNFESLIASLIPSISMKEIEAFVLNVVMPNLTSFIVDDGQKIHAQLLEMTFGKDFKECLSQDELQEFRSLHNTVPERQARQKSENVLVEKELQDDTSFLPSHLQKQQKKSKRRKGKKGNKPIQQNGATPSKKEEVIQTLTKKMNTVSLHEKPQREPQKVTTHQIKSHPVTAAQVKSTTPKVEKEKEKERDYVPSVRPTSNFSSVFGASRRQFSTANAISINVANRIAMWFRDPQKALFERGLTEKPSYVQKKVEIFKTMPIEFADWARKYGLKALSMSKFNSSERDSYYTIISRIELADGQFWDGFYVASFSGTKKNFLYHHSFTERPHNELIAEYAEKNHVLLDASDIDEKEASSQRTQEIAKSIEGSLNDVERFEIIPGFFTVKVFDRLKKIMYTLCFPQKKLA